MGGGARIAHRQHPGRLRRERLNTGERGRGQSRGPAPPGPSRCVWSLTCPRSPSATELGACSTLLVWGGPLEGGQNSPGAHFVGAFKHRCVFKLGAKEETGKCGKKHIPLLSVGRMTVAISPSLPNGEGSSAASCAVGRPCRVAAGARRPLGIRLPGGGCVGGGSGHDGPPAGSFLSLSCLPFPPRPATCLCARPGTFSGRNPRIRRRRSLLEMLGRGPRPQLCGFVVSERREEMPGAP